MVGDIMQPTHLLFVLVVALLVLGPKRLPEVGRQLGNGIRDFRAAINGERNEPHPVVEESFDMSDHGSPPEPTATPADHSFAHEGASSTATPPTDAAPGPGAGPAVVSDTEPAAVSSGATVAGPDVPAVHEFAHGSPAPDAAGEHRPS